MTEITIPFGKENISAILPKGSHVLTMPKNLPLQNPKDAILKALAQPIGAAPLQDIAKEKLAKAKEKGIAASACIVVSDNTRPVPYKGENGLIMPILNLLLNAGFCAKNIFILIATGTHRPMESAEIAAMLGKEPAEMGVSIINHNGTDEESLVLLGHTKRGSVIKVNKIYMQASLKILTGLVESHFMAGASGGRKSICPGILGREGTLVFHGAGMMSDENAKDLQIENNPVHAESLEAAEMAGADFIANVTLNRAFSITGIFCGHLCLAHNAAVNQLKKEVGINIEKPYDLVVSHGGFVAVNHYQAAKCGVAAIGALKPCGAMVIVANNTDKEPVGGAAYRTALALLKQIGPAAFNRLLKSPDWSFLFDQWQVQKWGQVLQHVKKGGLIYYAPQIGKEHWHCIPGENGAQFLQNKSSTAKNALATVVEKSVAQHMKAAGATAEDVILGRFTIAFLADGPYGIPQNKF